MQAGVGGRGGQGGVFEYLFVRRLGLAGTEASAAVAAAVLAFTGADTITPTICGIVFCLP
jgi:hypothetical protein